MASIKANMLRARLESEPEILVIDVREPDEFARATIPGAVNVPFDEHAADGIAHFVGDRRRAVVFVCAWGHRSAIATIALRRHGYRDVAYLEGGLEAWGWAAMPVAAGTRTLALATTVAERARAADP